MSEKKKQKTGKARNRFSGIMRADDGNRTRLASLGSWSSTDELHLHLVRLILYPCSVQNASFFCIFISFPFISFHLFFICSHDSLSAPAAKLLRAPCDWTVHVMCLFLKFCHIKKIFIKFPLKNSENYIKVKTVIAIRTSASQ